MTIPAPAKVAPAVIEVSTFMRTRGLTLIDLIEVGGEDLKSVNPGRVKKARDVEKCWSLMAKLGVKYADLEHSPSRPTAKPTRAQRGEGPPTKTPLLSTTSAADSEKANSLKNNNKTDNHSVGGSGKGRWKQKQRLISQGVEGVR
jgi:hypothetical protein